MIALICSARCAELAYASVLNEASSPTGSTNHDCHALLQLLARPLKTSGRLALSCLLETARKPTVRLWAEGSPIGTKDRLKARSYRRSQRRRSWYIDLDETQIEIERTYLSEAIFRRPVAHLPADRFTARDRFSARANPEI